MSKFDNLSAKVDAIVAIIPKIAKDYAALKKIIDDLRGQIDPNEQAKIDALTTKLSDSLNSLTDLDESVDENDPYPYPQPQPDEF